MPTTIPTAIAPWFRACARNPRRVLAFALVVSLLVHLALTQWPVHFGEDTDASSPLAVAITELPPPPAPAAQPVAPKPKPKRAAPVVTAAVPSATVVPEPAPEPVATPEPEPAAPEPAAVPLDEPVIVAGADLAPPPPKLLPPRVDLAYSAFLGTHGFLIGQAVYRLDHAGNDYTISTVAEARGLASLFFHGQGRATSVGTITSTGLQPTSFSIARTGTSNDRKESATFDWETGMVLLNEDKSAPLELPTFDPLVVLWQFYFAPPESDEMQFNIATTRKVYQVRLSNARATVELLLDSIRIDETVAQR